MAEGQKSKSLYFTSLALENVRCFGGQQTLQLADDNGIPAQWTMILGDNGVGKTTLLQCLARMRPKRTELDPQGEKVDDIVPEISELENEELDLLVRAGPDVTLTLEVKMAPFQGFKKPPVEGTSVKTGIRLGRQRNELKVVEPEATSEIKLINEPYLLGYGGRRAMGSPKSELDDFPDPLKSLFDADTPLLNVELILSQLDYGTKLRTPGAKDLRNRLKTSLAEILPDISKPSHIQIWGPQIGRNSKGPSGVYFKTPYGDVRLSQLSFGYQTISALIADMVWRMFEHYPNSRDPLAEPAIVLLDEIDLHLHPKWQRTMKEDLVRIFKKTQFICTAHSPLMAQTALDSNLVVLKKEDDHVVIENDPVVVEDWRVDQIVTSELFGLGSSRRPEIEKLFKDRDRLLDKRELSSKEEKDLRDIEARIYNLPTAEKAEDQEALELIRNAASLIKKNL